MNKNMSFETAMNQLNEIVVKLESGETSLDESLKNYLKKVRNWHLSAMTN